MILQFSDNQFIEQAFHKQVSVLSELGSFFNIAPHPTSELYFWLLDLETICTLVNNQHEIFAFTRTYSILPFGWCRQN
jgi:hypothetical protein